MTVPRLVIFLRFGLLGVAIAALGGCGGPEREHAAPQDVDLGTLAARAHPTGPGMHPTAAFKDLLALRDRPAVEAVPVLAQVVLDHAGSSRTLRYAAGQALYVSGTEEAHAALGAESGRGDFDGRIAFDYAFHWSMTPELRDGYLTRYVLRDAGDSPSVSLRSLPVSGDASSELRFEITLRNDLDRMVELGGPPFGPGQRLVFRAVEGHVARTLWPYGCQGLGGDLISLPPGTRHTEAFEVEVLPSDEVKNPQGPGVLNPGSVTARSRGWHYLLGETGPYEVIAFVCWKEGRAVSEPVRVEVTLP